jgi:hypothetical protein
VKISAMSRRLTIAGLAGLVLGAGLLITATPRAAHAAPSPDVCDLGYVWREAYSGDHVCVTPATRSQAAYDNSQASSRVDPNGAYGPTTCVQGYVWREAIPSDHVCVTPDVRSQTAYDNSQASSRAIGNPIVLHASIAFNNGVPVGGYADLTLYGDGEYTFSGHFHDSGFPSYDTGFVWVFRTSTGTAFTFSDTGNVEGTINPFGSRDHNWSSSGTNPALQAAWHDVQQGYNWQWEAKSSLDIGGMFNEIKTVIGYISTVIAVVGPLLG